MREEALGVDGGHAAGPRRRDRLAIDMIGDVAGGEHAGDLGRRLRGLFSGAGLQIVLITAC